MKSVTFLMKLGNGFLVKSKIIFALYFISLFSCNSLNAQKICIGAYAGPTVSMTYFNHTEGAYTGEMNPTLNFAVNAFFGYSFGDALGFSIEPGFIRKGASAKELGWAFEKRRVNYIHTPVMLNIEIINKLEFSVGPEFGYLLSEKLLIKDNFVDVTEDSSTQFELSGGASLAYNLFSSVSLGLKYTRGFTESSRTYVMDKNGDIIGDAAMYNHYFQVYFRYCFYSKTK